MADATRSEAYSPIMKLLHWTVALAVIALLLIGWTMTGYPLAPPLRSSLYALHKSLGVLVLLLMLVRLAWRLTHTVPALPPTLRPWEITVAVLVHRLFYVLLLIQPLTGWMLYSLAPHKSRFFGLFTIPDLPFLVAGPGSASALGLLADIHGALGSVLGVLLVLHVGAAVKHHFMARDDVLLHMAPAGLGSFLRALRGGR